MLGEARDVPAGTTLEADLCIVGGGAAGIAIAQDLIDSGLRVVLLESGGLEFEPDTQALYRGRSTGIPYFPLDSCRVRAFGGSTGHWAGTCRPFEAADFAPREGVPDTGWPIELGDVAAHYPAAAEVVGLPAGEWGLEPWADRDPFGPLALGEKVVSRVGRFATDEGRRMGTSFRDRLAAARNVHVVLHANVTEIETDPDGGRVERLHVSTLAGHRFTVAPRATVLACGALENARLMLASDRHQARGVGNERDVVGRYFIEHPRFVGAELLPLHAELETRFYEPHSVRGDEIEAYLALDDAVQREAGLLDVQLKLRPVYEGAFKDVEDSRDVRSFRVLQGKRDRQTARVSLGQDVANVAGDLMSWHRWTVPGSPLPVPYPEVVSEVATAGHRERRGLIPGLLGDVAAYTYTKLLGTAPVEKVEVTTRIGQQPRRDSRVVLGRERDALGLRRIDLDWRMTRLDLESAVGTLERFGAALGAAGVGRLRLLVDRDGGLPDEVRGGWHQMGTTRMSDDPKRGVVDRDCRVHGVRNLFVAGSSVFPTPGAGTPTLTLVALALRLSATLRKELA